MTCINQEVGQVLVEMCQQWDRLGASILKLLDQEVAKSNSQSGLPLSFTIGHPLVDRLLELRSAQELR